MTEVSCHVYKLKVYQHDKDMKKLEGKIAFKNVKVSLLFNEWTA
jgi:hypothetical protein